jgi:hypothetical protein
VTRKRGNGEGSISRHPKRDLWMARYTVETPAGTKRRTVYGKTRGEVRDKLARALAERADGLVFDDENMTVGEYVTRWLEDSAKVGLAHRTYANYKLQIRRHIVPAIGRVKLAKLNPPTSRVFTPPNCARDSNPLVCAASTRCCAGLWSRRSGGISSPVTRPHSLILPKFGRKR